VDRDAGIRVPEGFDARVFAEGIGRARHIAVRDNGDVYVALREARPEGGVAALRDEDRDGAADRIEYFGEHAGTGIGIHDGFLYASSDNAILRYPLPAGEALAPQSRPETVVEDFPRQRSHASKAFAIDDSGNLYVNVGAPSNACQEADRTRGSPGQEPCPLLENHAGIWRFDANKTGQTFEDGERFVTGTRNIVALDWNPLAGELYFAMHGRDQLHELFPDRYTVEESAELPAEEFHFVRQGANYGWPYTYWNHQAGVRVVAPEYGGDGATVTQEGEYEAPLLTFPGHWAPNDLLFYTAQVGFPAAARSSPSTVRGTGLPCRRAATTSCSCRSRTPRPLASGRCSPMASRAPRCSRIPMMPSSAQRASPRLPTAPCTSPTRSRAASGA
jgi:glucose/arabinose dehydrogenase